jgi:hypothetical protein
MFRRTVLPPSCVTLILPLWLGPMPSSAAQNTATVTPTPSPKPSQTPVPRYLIGFRAAWDNAMDLDLIVYQDSTEEMIYWDQRT